MRVDDYLSTVGVVKRRTIAKELASNGLIKVNGQRAKPAYQVRIGDIIFIKGNQSSCTEVLALPVGSVSREKRSIYFRDLPTN